MDTVIVASSQFYSHYPKRIPQGTVNAEAVLIRLDSEWDDLTVRIHWLNVASGVEKVVLLERDKPNTIPWEVLTDLGELRMGLVGMDGDTVIKPTIWLTYGYVSDGVDPESGSDPQPPTPSWEQQMVEQARVAAEAAREAKDAAVNAEKAASQVGPYANEAQKSAEAAKEAQREASTSAQEAGNAKDQANTASNAAKVHADAAGTAKVEAERAAETAGNAQSEASQSAKSAANSAKSAELAKQEAQNVAAALPAPSPEVAGMVPVVNQAGDGYIFGDIFGGSGPYDLLYSATIEEPDTMEVLVVAEKSIKSISVYAITPADDMQYSLQCYARINNNAVNQIVFGIGNLFQTTKNTGVVFFEKEKNLNLYTQKAAKKITTWYNGPVNEEVYFETSPNVTLPHNTIVITKNNSGKTYPLTAGTKLIVGVKYE